MDQSPKIDAVVNFYASGYEEIRLTVDTGQLESERTRQLLTRFLPQPPAIVLDVGGGAGAYALWLAKQRYEVHLTDISPVLIERAIAASSRQPEAPLASAKVGDARSMSWPEKTADAILLLGPLYHLTAREDRLRALNQAYRALKPGGILYAVGISRFASMMDGLRTGNLKDPQFAAVVDQDLKDGQHRNPTPNPQYFTDAYLHLPHELCDEVSEARFAISGTYGIEGPGWLVSRFDEWWGDPAHRATLMKIAGSVETEASMIGASAHMMIIARKSAS